MTISGPCIFNSNIFSGSTGVWKKNSNRFLDEPWWYGEINRQGRGSVRGLFPSNYITVTDQVRQRYRIRTPTGMVQNKNFTNFF